MGDLVLHKIASVLQKYVEKDGYAFRLGGEEFGLLYGTKNFERSVEKAQEIIKEVEELEMEHRYNTASNYVTISAGLMCTSQHVSEIKTIYKQADQNLYNAKRNGKNQLVTSSGE